MAGVIQFPGVETKPVTMERQLAGSIQHTVELGCAMSGLCSTLTLAARYVPDSMLDTIMDQVERAFGVRREVNQDSVLLGLHAAILPEAGLEGGHRE